MTNRALNEICRLNKDIRTNLQCADHIHAYLNQKETKLIVRITVSENCGGNMHLFDVASCYLSYDAILKREMNADRDNVIYSDEYFTNGIEWISDVKARN